MQPTSCSACLCAVFNDCCLTSARATACAVHLILQTGQSMGYAAQVAHMAFVGEFRQTAIDGVAKSIVAALCRCPLLEELKLSGLCVRCAAFAEDVSICVAACSNFVCSVRPPLTASLPAKLYVWPLETDGTLCLAGSCRRSSQQPLA